MNSKHGHISQWERQTDPLPDIVIRFNAIHTVRYRQCPLCPSFVSAGYTGHITIDLKRPMALNDPMWENDLFNYWLSKQGRANVRDVRSEKLLLDGFGVTLERLKQYVDGSRAHPRAISSLCWNRHVIETSAKRLRYYIIRRPSDGAYYVGSTV